MKIKSGKNAPKGGNSANIELFPISIRWKHDSVLVSAKNNSGANIHFVYRFRVLSSSGSRDFDVQTTHQR